MRDLSQNKISGGDGLLNSPIHPLHLMLFDDLPNKKQVWPGKAGSREEGLGRLVLLTPETVAFAATTCIRTGRRVNLGWELNKLEIANFGRNPCKHEIVSLLNGTAFDDIYTFNPQQSSQWDGLRHFSQPVPTDADPDRRLFYGGVTKQEILDDKNHRIGLQYWAKEGICGRGVLLDYVAYAERKGIAYSTFSDHAISLSVLLEIAEEANLTFRRGDILFVRIGVTKEWDTKMTAEDKNEYATTKSPKHAGIEGTEEMLRWLWDTGFAAVAGDAISFEVYPHKKSYTRGDRDVPGVFMHEYLLAGWGMPVGELFDLEALSEMCRAHQRWEFFVSSAPFNMPGGVSSPPNCLAIF
jgi:kynurenine formamidase